MFEKRLRALRKSRNLTQTQLADMLSVSASAIGMYEQGRRKPDAEMLTKICRTFDISLDYLIGITPEELPPIEVNEVLDKIREQLIKQEDLKFNGVTLTTQDIEKLMDAIRLTVSIVLSQNKI